MVIGGTEATGTGARGADSHHYVLVVQSSMLTVATEVGRTDCAAIPNVPAVRSLTFGANQIG